MSMGYGANYADVVNEQFVRRMAPISYPKFILALKQLKKTLRDFALAVRHEDHDMPWGTIRAWFKDVQKEFAQNTKFCETELKLYIRCHDSEEEGDRYDEVDGAFFSVGGVYEKTPAGKHFQRHIKRKFYVSFG